MIKCIIAGSRHIDDYLLVQNAIQDSSFAIDEVICGEARGVDTLGKLWAQKHQIPVKSFPAQWDVYGKSAGYIRNKLMASYASHLILIWDGRSRGSYHMKNLALEKKLVIFERIIE